MFGARVGADMAPHNPSVAKAHGAFMKAMTDLVVREDATEGGEVKIVPVAGLFQKATATTKEQAVEAVKKFANSTHQMGLSHVDTPSPSKCMGINPDEVQPTGAIMVFLTDNIVPKNDCVGSAGNPTSHSRVAQFFMKMAESDYPPLLIGKVAKCMKVPANNQCALPEGMYVSVKVITNTAPERFGSLKEFTVSLAELKANHVGVMSRHLHMALGGTASDDNLDLIKYEAYPVVVRDNDEKTHATVYPHKDRTAAKEAEAARANGTPATPAAAASQTVTVVQRNVNHTYAVDTYQSMASRVHKDYLGKVDPVKTPHDAVADQIIAILKNFLCPGQKAPKIAASIDAKKAWDILALNFNRTTIAMLLPASYSFHDIDLMVGLVDRIQHEVIGTALIYFPRWYSAVKFHAHLDCNGLEKGAMLDLLGSKLREMSSKPFDLDATDDARTPSSREYHLFGTQWDESDPLYRQAISRTQSARITAAALNNGRQQNATAKAGTQPKSAKRQKTQAGPQKQSLLQKHSVAIGKAGPPPAGATVPCTFGKLCKNKASCPHPHSAAEVGDQTYADALKAAGMQLE